MKLKHIMIISIIILSLVLPVSQAKPISVNISGPMTVGVNDTYQYKIVVTGFFTEYGFHLFLTGSNLTGATKTELYGYSNTSNVFYVNITFPSIPQTVYIYVMGIGYLNGSSPQYTITYLQVKVVKSVPISVVIKNPSQYEINNITVTFLLNGNYIGSSKISSIAPNGTANATLYYAGNFTEGVNVITVRINSQLLKFSNGSNSTQIYFNYGPLPNYSWVWYAFAGVLIVVIFFIVLFRPGKKMPSMPKWKK